MKRGGIISTVRIGPSKSKKIGLSASSFGWILGAFLNIFFNSGYLSALQLLSILAFLIIGGTFAYRPPVQITFVVGTEELHEVKYVHKEAITETRIFVDGDAVINRSVFGTNHAKTISNSELELKKSMRLESREKDLDLVRCGAELHSVFQWMELF